MHFGFLTLLFVPFFDLAASGALIEASGEQPAEATDPAGDTIGGIGSGIVYDEANDVYLMVSDRGPGDGTLPYRPRIAVVRLTQEGKTIIPRVIETILLKDSEGRPMTGLIPDDPDSEHPKMKDGRTCIDPEALALAGDGRLFISDEYGPFLYEFRRDGTMVRRIALPAEFDPREADGRRNYTDKAALVSGRAVNQGPEGMCLLPGGNQAALVFQSGSVQDGGKAPAATKILVLDLATGQPTAIYRYLFSPDIAGVEATRLSVNDLVALSDRRFLVLERDGAGRDGKKDHQPARYKAVWLADTSDATNLLDSAPGKPEKPVTKTLLFNLATLVDDSPRLAAKWEGLVVIPPSDDKSLTLLMTADNDFLAPEIREEGTRYPFLRAEDAVPTQFFKIRVPLPAPP